jgi:hypothetical protein
MYCLPQDGIMDRFPKTIAYSGVIQRSDPDLFFLAKSREKKNRLTLFPRKPSIFICPM